MKTKTLEIIENLINRYPYLSTCKKDIEEAITSIVDMQNSGNKLLLCGNGGSAADCEHISGELLKSFMLRRKIQDRSISKLKEIGLEDNNINNLQQGIRAIPLPSLSSALTAYLNDNDPIMVYAQLVYALGLQNDILIAISTSGNSKNVYNAVLVAKALDIKTIGLTGKTGGLLNNICDICIKVPETETYKIQELHLPIYHCICLGVETELFEN